MHPAPCSRTQQDIKLQGELDSHKEIDKSDSSRDPVITADKKHILEIVLDEYLRPIRETPNTYGNEFWKLDPQISPLRGALAIWGLTIDDLDVATLPGTPPSEK